MGRSAEDFRVRTPVREPAFVKKEVKLFSKFWLGNHKKQDVNNAMGIEEGEHACNQ